MSTDAHFTIGCTHKTCEDYALAGDNFALVLDGCSNSPHTDVGARMVAWGIAPYTSMDGFAANVPVLLHTVRGAIAPNVSLDATILYANKQGEVFAYGDGYIAARERESGSWAVYRIEFSGNAPAYASYNLRRSIPAEFLARFPDDDPFGTAHYARITLDAKGNANRTWDEDPGFTVFRTVTLTPLADGSAHAAKVVPITMSFNPAVYDLIVLMTDGIGSFATSTTHYADPVSDITILGKLLDFKGLTGEFVTRRLNAFMKRVAAKEGWSNHDDVGMAAVVLDNPVEVQ